MGIENSVKKTIRLFFWEEENNQLQNNVYGKIYTYLMRKRISMENNVTKKK
jgi:hypothetical protein